MRNTFPRTVKLPKNQSFFLFGGRGTGKSFLLKERFSAATTHYIDLLNTTTEALFSKDPGLLYSEIIGLPNSIQVCVIDEIQKVPRLLNEIHRLIENPDVKLQFALTGSSARKLKTGGANLLAGRAVLRSLFPLLPEELGEKFDLLDYLTWGGLPKVWQLDDEQEIRDYLMSYVSVYLKEEVWAEQLVRSMEPFRRFLEVAAQCSGKILNFRNIARDTGIDPKTAANWFSVLEDTLVGFYLDSYDASIRRQMRKAAKFFLFDVGVTRALSGMLSHKPAEATSYYGELFEQFLIAQIHAKNIYLQLDYQLSYLQTKAGLEIDLIIQRPGKALLLVEIKSKSKIDDRDMRHLEKLQTDFKGAEFILLSRDMVSKKFGNITCLHYLSFLEQLGEK